MSDSHPRTTLFSSLALAALFSACTTSNPAPPPSGPAYASAPPPSGAPAGPPERRSGDPTATFAEMLGGRYDGVTPGNMLHLSIQSVGFHTLSHPYDLFVEISGQFDGENVRQQGFLHLESQGRGVYVGYIPHFDATVSALSPRASRFSANEANAACSLYMLPQGDGFVGENQGTTCAFAIRGAIGRWSLQVEPGGLVVRSESSGETLRFRRTTS
ncbi:MAG: hypothetical protein M3S32_00695 [Acidobacteriota bacterium]|nr:hypothetical protein [Acidobacteriota bacterium]